MTKLRINKRLVSKPRFKTQEQRIATVARQVFNNHVEKKVFSVSTVGLAVATGGTMIDVTNGIIEGDDLSNRSGTAIKLVRIRALYRGTAVTTSSSVRFILFRDMLNQGSTPSTVNLLPAGNWISQYSDTREIQQHRFKILHDVTLDLSIAGENVKTRQYDIPVSGTTYYNGATAVAASNGPGAIFCLIIGNAISTATDHTIQLVFTDA